MKAMPPMLLNGTVWLDRLGHVGRRAVPALCVAALLGAGLVVVRAAMASRANLAFDARLYRSAAERLADRTDALERMVARSSTEELLARYARPKPPPPSPPPVIQIAAPAPPDPGAVLRTWRLRGILQQGGQPMAMLNDEIVAVGDRLQGFTIAGIAETFVDVRDAEGRLHRLDLYDRLPGKTKRQEP